MRPGSAFRAFAVLSAYSLLTASCFRATAPTTAATRAVAFSITVADPVVRFTRTTSGIWTDVTASITNAADSTLYTDRCYVEAQRLIEQQWTTVWNQSCAALVLDSIAARGVVVRKVRIFGSLDPKDAIRADPRLVAGTYRLTFPLSYKASSQTAPNEPGIPSLAALPSVDDRSTSPFEIRDP